MPFAEIAEALEAAHDKLRSGEITLMVTFIDIDNFKEVNDRYGHLGGDRLLLDFAQMLQGIFGDMGCVARYGGDEFVIILPEADLEAARSVAKRICAKITSTNFRGEYLSVSAGVAQWSPDFPKATQFLKIADQAMYQAKRAGGSRLFVLTP